MRIPKGMTKAQVEQTIDIVVNRLGPRFQFGYFTAADMKQQGWIFALEALDRYDENRPLENFMYTHVRNRFINFKRDKYKRNDAPCKLCHNALDGETKHDDGMYCSKYQAWKKRNLSKQNIINPLDISHISDDKESNTRTKSSVLDDLEYDEIISQIDEQLPVELRSTYLQMIQGESVPKNKRLEVERAVLAIMEGSVLCPSAEL